MASPGPGDKEAKSKNMFEVYVEDAIMGNGEHAEVLDHMDQL